jgi:two-component system, NarL family, nitrate/nitrite response regulator NarL
MKPKSSSNGRVLDTALSYHELLSPLETTRSLRVFIVSDVRLCREGLALLLAEQRSIDVVGSASAPKAIREIVELQPDIVLLDASAVDVRALARGICDIMPDTKLIALAICEIDEEVISWAEAGIVAYVTRESSSEEMLDILHQAVRGDFVCPQRLTSSLFRYIAASSAKRLWLNSAVMPERDNGDFTLTRREKDIIPFIAQGLTNKEIARSLGVGPSTIKNHVHNILEKLRLRRRGEIAAQARQTQRMFFEQPDARGLTTANPDLDAVARRACTVK